MAHVRQSRPDSGLGFQAKVLKTFQSVPCSLGCCRVFGYDNVPREAHEVVQLRRFAG